MSELGNPNSFTELIEKSEAEEVDKEAFAEIYAVCADVYANINVVYEEEDYDIERLYLVMSKYFEDSNDYSFDFVKGLLRLFEASLPDCDGEDVNGVRVYRLYTLFAIGDMMFKL